MGVPILHHTRMCPPREAPSATIPVTMIARDLQPDEFLLPHTHPWGQVTMALEGVLRITANNSSWVLPPMRAIWIAPNVEHAVTILEKPVCAPCASMPRARRSRAATARCWKCRDCCAS